MAPFKTRNAGQVCISPTRFLVQDKIADQFTEGFISALEKTKIGNGLDKDTEMGPMANERRIPVIEEMISDAKAKGATVASGGSRIGNKGYFFQPTVLTDVPTDATMMNEEPFGPVAIVNRFSTYEDAITEANRSAVRSRFLCLYVVGRDGAALGSGNGNWHADYQPYGASASRSAVRWY